jgi:hypothetical protein
VSNIGSIQSEYAISQARAAQAGAASSGAMTAEEAATFSKTLANEMALLQASSVGSSGASGTHPFSIYTPTLLNATAGQSLGSQIMMLLMMMMTGEADASTFMTVMAQAVGAMQGEGDEKEKLRGDIMDANYENELMAQLSGGMTGGSGIYPAEAWKPAIPAVVSTADQRSAAAYEAVIGQFDVENSKRYQNNKYGNGDTYCNIFLWDVTSAMNAEIPHYVDRSTGAPRAYPDTEGAYELSANGISDWLERHGRQYGWVEVSAREAQAHADSGGPAITSWYNASGGSGHVQVVRPSGGGGYDEARGVAVAQAGARRTESSYANDIYADRAMSQLKYYIHR